MIYLHTFAFWKGNICAEAGSFKDIRQVGQNTLQLQVLTKWNTVVLYLVQSCWYQFTSDWIVGTEWTVDYVYFMLTPVEFLFLLMYGWNRHKTGVFLYWTVHFRFHGTSRPRHHALPFTYLTWSWSSQTRLQPRSL